MTSPRQQLAAPVDLEVSGVHQVLDRLQDSIESARAMPMSASCVVNRTELLSLLDELRSALPPALSLAQAVLDSRREVVEEGHRQAQRVLGRAHQERQRMLADTDLHGEASAQADELLADAAKQAEAIRREADSYADAKLATFEVVLGKTLDAVVRGRAQLHGERELDLLRSEEIDDRPLPG